MPPSLMRADRRIVTCMESSMSSPMKNSGWQIGPVWVRSTAFFAFFYLYLWLVVDVGLVYYGHEVTTEFPTFLCGTAFLKDFLMYPGGLLEYASAGISQYFYYGWAGALIATIVAALLCLLGRLFVAAATGVRTRLLHYIPALIVLVLYSGYLHQLTAYLVVLSALALACAYSWLPMRNGPLRLAVFVLLVGCLHYVAGGAYLLFGLLCAVFEVLRRRKWALAGACLAVTGVVPYVIGRQIMLVPAAAAYGRLLPLQGKDITLAANGRLLPLQGKDIWQTAVLLPSLWSFSVLAPPAVAVWRAVAATKAGRAPTEPGRPPGRLRWRAGTAALLAVAALCAALSFEVGFRTPLRIERYARAGDWPELLREARRLESYDLALGWHVNRALYHTRQLPYQMFCFQQSQLHLLPSEVAFRNYGMPDIVYVDFAALMFELGRVNTAEYLAYRGLEFVGERPFLLQRLALISLAKGETEAARVLLGALSRDLIMGDRARRYLGSLEAGPALSADERIQEVRSRMTVKDTIGFGPIEQMLLDLLERNPRNRMAFEYLMAYCLLTRDLNGFVANIGRLEDFSYPHMPRHYEEALALHAFAGGTTPELGNRTVRWETLSRLGEFNAILKRFGNDTAGAREAAAPEFGDSYFFYFKFGIPGVAG